MTQIEIPLSFGVVLIFIGVIILAGGIIDLLSNAPLLGSVMGGAEAAALATRYLLSWFFVIFGSIFIVMGIRRVKPA